MYFAPIGTEEFAGTPLERLQSGAIAGDPAAQYALGVALIEGNDTPMDRPRALAWFMQSAARGNAQAVDTRDRLYAAMHDGERVRAENLSRSLESPISAIRNLTLGMTLDQVHDTLGNDATRVQRKQIRPGEVLTGPTRKRDLFQSTARPVLRNSHTSGTAAVAVTANRKKVFR